MTARTGITTAAILAAGLLAPSLLGDSSLTNMSLFLPFALLALSVNILWGENRLVSFGHGAFFALGGYTGGLILVGHPYDPAGGAASLLDEGASQSGFERILEALNGVAVAQIPVLALVLPMVLCGALGLVIGAVVFRAASPDVYLPLISLGVCVVAGIWFNELEFVGASNGLGGVPEFTAELAPGSKTAPYYFNLAFVLAAFGAWALFRTTTRGATFRALGDDPVRLEALGYPVARLRTYGFGTSTAVAGLAGALYAATANFMSPSLSSVSFSAQALIWVAVGGVGTVLGPLIGTLLVKWGEEWLSSGLGLDTSWPLILGLLLILVVLLTPGGVMGGRKELLRLRASGRLGLPANLQRRPAAAVASPASDHSQETR